MLDKEFEVFESKLTVLNSFVVQLRTTTNENCLRLSDALEAVLKTGSFDEIETAFEWCREEYLKLNGAVKEERDSG